MSKFVKKIALVLVLVLLSQFINISLIFADSLYGDLNADNSVNSIDYAILRGYLISKHLLSGTDWLARADVYKDGEINSLDLAVFRKYLLGKIKSLPYIAEQNVNTPTPTGIVSATPTPTDEWVPFIPKPEDVSINLILDRRNYIERRNENAIQVCITFNDGGYRIVDKGKLMCYRLETGEWLFYTSGVKIEKYVGSGGVTMALMYEEIEYLIEEELTERNHFDFRVYDTTVTGFSFSKYSVLDPEPVPYTGTVNENFVNANTQFAANLFEKFSEEDAEKNVFFSPLSISMALSMVYQGADTTTKEAMAKALNYTGLTDEEINQSYREHLSYFKKLYPQVELNIANSIWIRENFRVEESFLDKNKEVFDAQSYFLDFSKSEACDIMNKWISDATKGKINNMIKPPIDPDTIMYLMNALYFKGNWMKEFDETNTKNSLFTNIKGEKKLVPMMNKTYKYKYAQTSEYRAVELPYGAGNISMYCILPEEGNVNDFIAEFDSNKWNTIKGSLSVGPSVKLSIPKFKIEYEPHDIPGKLKELGRGEAFYSGADFSGISDDVWIIDVKHKAVIEVNEKGTEAAAVTVIGVPTSALPNSFIADRPFMFVIADNATGTILFMGKVVDID